MTMSDYQTTLGPLALPSFSDNDKKNMGPTIAHGLKHGYDNLSAQEQTGVIRALLAHIHSASNLHGAMTYIPEYYRHEAWKKPTDITANVLIALYHLVNLTGHNVAAAQEHILEAHKKRVGNTKELIPVIADDVPRAMYTVGVKRAVAEEQENARKKQLGKAKAAVRLLEAQVGGKRRQSAGHDKENEDEGNDEQEQQQPVAKKAKS